MRTPKFEYWIAARNDWRWHLKATNGEIVAQGEGYKTRAGAVKALRRLRTLADTATETEIQGAKFL